MNHLIYDFSNTMSSQNEITLDTIAKKNALHIKTMLAKIMYEHNHIMLKK